MATIYKEIIVNAPPAFVWEAIKDFGAVHTRFARGFVTNTVRSGDERTVTFASGFVAREHLVSMDNDLRRLVYTLVEGPATHHNASFQVLDAPGGQTRLVWITDLLPEDVRPMVAQMVDLGSDAIRETLETAAVSARR